MLVADASSTTSIIARQQGANQLKISYRKLDGSPNRTMDQAVLAPIDVDALTQNDFPPSIRLVQFEGFAAKTWQVATTRDDLGIAASATRTGFLFPRFLVVLTLLGLEIFNFVQEDGQQHLSPSSAVNALSENWSKRQKGKHHDGGGSLTGRGWLDLTLCLTYLYAAFLALVTVTARAVRASVTSFHLSSLLLGTFSVYAYRNIWPLLTFTLSPVDAWEVFLAYRVPHLSHDMLPPLADYDYTKNLVKRSFKAGREYIQLVVLVVIRVFASLMAPFGMNQLLGYLETRGEGAVIRPWVWVTYLFLGPALRSIAFQWRMTSSSPAITATAIPEVRSGATTPDGGSVVDINHRVRGRGREQARRLGASNRRPRRRAPRASLKRKLPGSDSGKDEDKDPRDSSDLVGKMNNLISTDLENLADGRDFLLLVVMCVWFLYNILGWSAFVGMVVMIVLFPIPGTIAGKIQKVQKEVVKRTDARVQVATETMGILRMIKLFGWEPKIATRLDEKREQELQYIKLRQILNLINGNINLFIPIITMIVTYVTYTVIMNRALTPSAIFSSMVVFELLRDQLNNIFWMIPMLIQARVSLDRVNDFLHNTELLDEFVDAEKSSEMLMDASHFNQDVIGFQNASFTWSNNNADTSQRRFTLRVQGELLFKRGCFNLIIGPTGSGKTSLLMALLGEMHFVPMSPDSWYHLPRAGGISYAAQESWVQNETIRDNILFGSPYDEERYNKVIYQCGLQRDLSLFDAGDKTEVGEKGLTLSGGQKARVTLARAVYSSAQILILDDIIDIVLAKVLAALDVHTAQWIVEECFKGDLIRGRTVLLVTHNIAMASPLADYVVSLGKDGRIASRGSVSDALEKDKTLAKELTEGVRVIKDDDKKIDTEEPGETAKLADGKLILAEEITEGHVSWGAVLFWILFVGGLLLSGTLMTVQTWFMGYWAEQYDIYPPEQVNITFYLAVYGLILLTATTSYMTAYGVYVFGTLRASRSIHRNLIESVLGTTLRWLDTTPTSRVITRVTQDIRALDGPISNTFSRFIDVSATMLLKFVAVVYLTPAFSVPGVAIAFLGAWLGRVYMKAQIAIKREMSNAKAPVLGHFGASVAGLTSIRAYGAQPAFREESYRRIDRWISLRIDFLGGLFAAGLAAYLIYVPRERSLPSDTGFSLTMAIGFSGMILWWVCEEMLICATYSLERMHSYINAEQEPMPTKQGIPPAYWPASGDLRVEKLSARYSLVRDMSVLAMTGRRFSTTYLSISNLVNVWALVMALDQWNSRSHGKRQGICSHLDRFLKLRLLNTPQSSLTLSLLRCIFTEGSVYYDGRLTSSINLNALRSSITIIPQIPELLSGSLRENLDPFSQYDEATLNGALRASGLFSLQSDDEDGRLTLDSQIASGGGNLSVGQRQILALARAIVRGSKLLILDEDYKTDMIIQTSLRNELKEDVTLITVAHRLQTIIEADKVMVLDAGRIVEFDKPRELLKAENGRFRSLVDESGDKDLLYSMALSAGTTQHGGTTTTTTTTTAT
ncbi:hypothetical protein BJY52DRAFT_1227472 [Lactarius psammicola]|nr:hypothetical protein BJY52DRAFT_1227472 [Lactarius psammicola]